jgi:hypothetical protein
MVGTAKLPAVHTFVAPDVVVHGNVCVVQHSRRAMILPYIGL